MAEAAKPNAFRRNVKWQLAGSAAQSIVSGALLLLMGRQLQATGFGVFSIVMGYVLVVNLLFEPRIQDVAARQFWDLTVDEATRVHHRQYFIDLFLLEAIGKLIPCLALMLGSKWLAAAGNLPPEASNLIVLAALGTYLSRLGNGLSLGLLRVLGRSDVYAYCATGEPLLRLLLTLAVVQFSELTVMASIVILAFSGILGNTLQWWLTVKLFGGIRTALRQWRASAAIKRLRENRRLLFSNLGLSVADLMNKDLDVALISPLISADQVGIYKMAKNLALLTWRAVDPFYMALMPEVSRLVAASRFTELRRLLVRSSTGLLVMAVALSIASYALVLLFGEAVLGSAFAEVARLMPWMLVGIVTSAPLVWGHPLSVALNRADVAVAGSAIGAIVGLVAFLTLTPGYGMYGAGAAWTVAFVIHFLFTSTVAHLLMRRRARLHNQPAPA